MENLEEVLQTLDEFTKLKPKEIPKELEEYLSYVAKTGDPVYQWSLVKCLFREKLLNVITEFYEGCPSVDLPPCPNVDTFNYEIMKNCLIERLESFASAPFTVQRLCELLTSPKKQYSRADKFMRAVEKNILVVSTREPGQSRRVESSQPELVNGVADSTGNEPSRVGIAIAEVVASSTSSTSGSFLNTEGAVQVIFEDGSLDKNHAKCYEDGYESGVPRRTSSWFRERIASPDKISSFIASPDKITSFGSLIHSDLTARLGDGSNVEVGNQLEEKYHGPIADRGIVEDDDEEDYIEDDYVEPTQNVQSFQSQDPNAPSLDLEGAEGYCSPPSPEEENLETSVAVSNIAEENSASVDEASTLKDGVLSQIDLVSQLTSETSQELKITESKPNVEERSCDDLKPEESQESVSLDSKNDLEEQSLDCIGDEEDSFPTVEEASNAVIDAVMETAELASTAACMEGDSLEARSDDSQTDSLAPTVAEATTCDGERIEVIEASKCPSPKPIAAEALEPEVGLDVSADALSSCIVEEPGIPVETDSSVIVDKSAAIKELELTEPEPTVAEMNIGLLDSLKSIAPAENPKITSPEESVHDELASSCSESNDASPEPVGTVLNDSESVSESSVKESDAMPESSPELLAETAESPTSLEEERDREMMIQNERVESVIQENVEQAPIPLPEEILMQQIFVPRETPMDEKTSESEPEAMDVDETSQTVEEPMEQGDVSPTTIS